MKGLKNVLLYAATTASMVIIGLSPMLKEVWPVKTTVLFMAASAWLMLFGWANIRDKKDVPRLPEKIVEYELIDRGSGIQEFIPVRETR